ncbi:MAG: hypothetical protein H0U37_05600 [Chloroflexi bacterium]|nr:hypothetical protein [Chloroflexota bacterium]
MIRDPEANRLRGVIDAVEEATGTLPELIAAARRAVDTLRAAVGPAVEKATACDLASRRYALGEEIAALAETGVVPDIAKRAAAAVAASQAAIAERDILSTALETAETILKSRTHGGLDEMLDLLRERRSRLFSEVAAIAGPVAGRDLTTDPMRLPEETRVAYLQVFDLATVEAKIVTAYDRLARVMGSPNVDDGLFAAYRNAPDVWGPQLQARHINAWRPSPRTDDKVEQLLWLAGLGREYAAAKPEPWLPTPDERDAAMTAYAEPRKLKSTAWTT